MRTEEALAGKHLVITGFTGFVAKVLVAMLLERAPDIGRITLLIRPRGRIRPALVRAEKIVDTSPVFRTLRARHGARLADFLAGRLDALDSDVEKPRCGLDDEGLDRLAGADAVIHCAGLTDFAPDPLKALTANVAGATHAAQLAEELGCPLVHVSTCYVAGARGRAVIEEALAVGVSPNGQRLDAAAEVRALQLACRGVEAAGDRIRIGMERAEALGWPNIYTYTKGLAEHLLARRPGLDLTIVRPSIVECAREFPFAGWNEGLNTAGPLAWLISTAFRRLPTVPAHRFDVIPVDDVAKGLAAITAAAIRGFGGGVFQLASSDHNPLTFDRAVELTGLGMRRWTRKGGGRTVDRALFRFLDPVPVPAEAPGPLAVDRLRGWAKDLRALLREEPVPEPLEKLVGDRLASLRARLADQLGEADETLERVERMLALYRPFIHDNDWEFRTGRARALTAHEGAFRFDLSDLDWCDYWVDVEYPGLRTWCIPILDGVEIPSDPPSSPPFRLQRTEWAHRVASK